MTLVPGDITNRDEREKELGIRSGKATEDQVLNKVLFVTQQNEALNKALIFWARELSERESKHRHACLRPGKW